MRPKIQVFGDRAIIQCRGVVLESLQDLMDMAPQGIVELILVDSVQRYFKDSTLVPGKHLSVFRHTEHGWRHAYSVGGEEGRKTLFWIRARIGK